MRRAFQLHCGWHPCELRALHFHNPAALLEDGVLRAQYATRQTEEMRVALLVERVRSYTQSCSLPLRVWRPEPCFCLSVQFCDEAVTATSRHLKSAPDSLVELPVFAYVHDLFHSFLSAAQIPLQLHRTRALWRREARLKLEIRTVWAQQQRQQGHKHVRTALVKSRSKFS